ncbi:hypothetical protein DPMN_091242 [Dreissena polymorpha]|uniref:Uncharacterized protein n=1 Tax=Dreissena polymorpha TaxID=45954 RepID=A0A9D4L069_DREPO|nr:hypothetical protein DPMN_091242 [Dreissena polymorpha]
MQANPDKSQAICIFKHPCDTTSKNNKLNMSKGNTNLDLLRKLLVGASWAISHRSARATFNKIAEANLKEEKKNIHL